jgi:hypothetical protein
VFQRIRPDAIQGLTSIRVSISRHSYGKTAAIVRMMCDLVRTMFSIRQDVHTKFKCPDVQPSWFRRSSFIYGNCVHQFNRPDVTFKVWTLQSLIMVITCSQSEIVRTLRQHRPDAAFLWKLSVLFWKGSCS